MIVKRIKIDGFSTSLVMAKIGSCEDVAEFLDCDLSTIQRMNTWAAKQFKKQKEMRFAMLERYTVPAEDMLVEVAFSVCKMSGKKATKKRVLFIMSEINKEWYEQIGFQQFKPEKEPEKTELEKIGAVKIIGSWDSSLPMFSPWKLFAASNCSKIDINKDIYTLRFNKESKMYVQTVVSEPEGNRTTQLFGYSPKESVYIGHSKSRKFVVFSMIDGLKAESECETAEEAMNKAKTLNRIKS